MLTRYLRFIALAAFWTGLPVAAHHVTGNLATPNVPGIGAPTVSLEGQVDQIVIEDLATKATVRVPVLVARDGRRFTLAGPAADGLAAGTAITVTGKQEGRALFADSTQALGASDAPYAQTKAAPATSFSGVLRLGHADNFDGSPSEFFYALEGSDGRMTRVGLATLLGVLKNGMHVTITGRLDADGELAADSISIVAPPETKPDGGFTLNAVTTSYIVIPIKFPTNAAAPWTYGADPFTPAALNTAVFGPTSPVGTDVKSYYNEVSYGQQLLSGITANNGSGGFLLATVAKPATCDITVIANAADAAATARGYNLASYTGRLYVFNNVSGCGWSGLAYVGWARAYSNNTTNLLVIAHELGHNFGLAHAASLDCGTNAIGGTCTSAEYGDPFDVMGNNRAMHFNSAQKSQLNWLAPSTIATHSTGTTTYTLSPIETGGALHYAVKVPASANRNYWIEYRQPIGFDGALSSFPNNGAQIRVASPFESLCGGCFDDTEFLDMTPGTASFTDGALVAGQNFADSIYGIGVNVVSATAGTLTIQVTAPGAGSSTITQTSSVNPSTYGSNVTFTATVTAAGLTGFVNFTENGGAIAGCGPLALTGASPYVVSCTTASILPGTHNIVAVYAGDSGHKSTASSAIAQVISKATSSVTLASSANPSPPATSVTFTATVTGNGSASPTGTVNFTDGGTTLTGCGTVALTGSGNSRTATCTTVTLTAGIHSIVAVFAGDAIYTGSTSPTLSQSVGTGTSTTGLASSLNPSSAGASVTFTATVTGTAPTGNVNFTSGGTTITGCGAKALSGSGNVRTATCATAALATGANSIVAIYAGDAGNTGSSSPTLTQNVLASTTTVLGTSVNPSMLGAMVTLTATVNGNAPTGNVNFKDGGVTIAGCGAQPLGGGGNSPTATCATSTLGVGGHSITATYAGDSGNAGSTSSAMAQVVKMNSATAIASSLNPSNAGEAVVFTATVAGTAPTGSVDFRDGGTSIPGCATAPLAGGGNSRTATCSTTGLTAGSHSITAVYGGDANNLGSSSPVLTQNVNAVAPGPPTLQLAASRKVHGAAGTFDLLLSLVPTSPTTEPRAGPAATIVLTFNKPLTGATATVTEGVATAGAPTISGSDVVVGLTGVSDQQYVTISLTNVASADGASGGTGSVRLGFLAGDVNQNRAVTVSDLGMVNAQLAQPVTAANYLFDINASGTMTVGDKGMTSSNLARSLPAP